MKSAGSKMTSESRNDESARNKVTSEHRKSAESTAIGGQADGNVHIMLGDKTAPVKVLVL